jgi:hypothetical protein
VISLKRVREIGGTSTAYKVRLVNSNLHFISDDKLKVITSEIDYTVNTANGINQSYDRIDLAVGYLQPIGWSTTGMAKLGYYYVNYSEMLPTRADNDFTLTAGGSKKLNNIFSTGLVGTYAMNQSNTDAYTYNKWTVMLTMSALYAF